MKDTFFYSLSAGLELNQKASWSLHLRFQLKKDGETNGKSLSDLLSAELSHIQKVYKDQAPWEKQEDKFETNTYIPHASEITGLERNPAALTATK